MLFRQNFRRGHEHSLVAVFHSQQHGAKRYHRFAGTDIPLQQAVHRTRGTQVVKNFVDNFLLAVCKSKPKVFPKRRQ